MNDDSTRTVTLTEFNGTVWNDWQQYAGELLNTTIYDRAGGTPIQVTRNTPWSVVTSTRTLTRDWAVPTVHRSYIVLRTSRHLCDPGYVGSLPVDAGDPLGGQVCGEFGEAPFDAQSAAPSTSRSRDA